MLPDWEHSRDEEWARMWCYLTAAVAGALLPWLISLRAVWSTRLGAGLGGLAAFALFAVACGDWGSAMKEWPWAAGCDMFLWGGFGLFLLAGLLPSLRRNLRMATAPEGAGLRRAGRVLVALAGGFGLFVLTVLAGLIVAFDRSELHWWECAMVYPLSVAMFAPIFWPVAELLPRGRWQRVSYRLFLYLLLPGLLAAAPAYLLEGDMLLPGEPLMSVQALMVVIPLAIALFLWRYVHHCIAESSREK